MTEAMTTTLELQSEDVDMRGQAVGRDAVLAHLKATVRSIERDIAEDKIEQLPKGVANAQELAERLNDATEWYVCGCGSAFETQAGYAGHQNWCEHND